MSSIINPNDAYIKPAYDPIMDKPATKREVQGALDHFSRLMDEVFASIDTQHIVINFVAERLGVKKEELLEYAEKKKAEIQASIETQQAKTKVEADALSNV